MVADATHACASCSVGVYCSAACQARHWPAHAALCAAIEAHRAGRIDARALLAAAHANTGAPMRALPDEMLLRVLLALVPAEYTEDDALRDGPDAFVERYKKVAAAMEAVRAVRQAGRFLASVGRDWVLWQSLYMAMPHLARVPLHTLGEPSLTYEQGAVRTYRNQKRVYEQCMSDIAFASLLALERIAYERLRADAEWGLAMVNIHTSVCGHLWPAVSLMTSAWSFVANDARLRLLTPYIGHLTQLQVLEVSGNGLTRLPDELANLTALRTLYISANPFGRVPDVVFRCTSLKRLHLDSIGATRVSDDIGELVHLTALDAGDNPLTGLPDALLKLTALETLVLNDSSMDQVPAVVWRLQTLHSLQIDGNRLKSLHSDVRNLTNLQKLNVARNELDTLPSDLAALSALTYLDASNNRMDTVPPVLRQMPSVQVFDLVGNNFSDAEKHRLVDRGRRLQRYMV